MKPEITDKTRKTGVCHALTDSGLELPVIDVTHPAFSAQKLNPAEEETLIKKAVAEQEARNRMPSFIGKPLMWFLSKNSVLMRNLRGASGSFLSGMNTYLMKLGPENLDPAKFSNIDRMIASSLPAFSLRLRLQDTARLLASGLAPQLVSRSGRPLTFINIAGGPCMDSLNALILLHKENPDLLAGRDISIHVLDLEKPGPAFAGRALESLQKDSGPLSGLNASLVHVPYDWSQESGLEKYLDGLGLADRAVGVSSEGGLFNYGTDGEITGNLTVLRDTTPAQTVLVGTITPAAGPGAAFEKLSGVSTIARSLADFSLLAGKSGWKVTDSLEQPMNHVVGMRKK